MRTLTLLFLIILPSFAVAKAGSEVPVTSLSFQIAYDLAHKSLLASKHNIDPVYAKAKEYILESISYDKINKNWIWGIKFFHPVANDHSVTYHVHQNSEIVLISATE